MYDRAECAMKILITDDHALLRDSLSMLLMDRFGSKLELMHADNGRVALEQIAIHPDLDLILLDIDRPDIHGFQVLKQIIATQPDKRVITVSGSDSASFIRQCISLGAAGFIPKTSSGRTMLSAIEMVLGGGSYVPRDVFEGSSAAKAANEENSASLTARQVEVLKLIRKGLSNEAIADALGISMATVKSHVRSILDCLGVKNRTEAVNEALLLNLL